MSRRRVGIIIAIGLCAAIAVMAAAGWSLVYQAGRLGAARDQETLLAVASAAAAALETEQVVALESPDTRADALAEVHGELERLQAVLPNVRSVCLLSNPAQASSRLLAYTGPESACQALGSPLGQRADQLRNVFSTRKPDIAVHSDQSGAWFSTFAPVRDPGSGKILAAIGFEVPASQWNTDQTRYRTLAAAILALGGTIFILTCAAVLLQRRAQMRSAKLLVELEREAEALAHANHIVENSSTVAFRITPPALPLTYVSRNVERFGYRPEDLLAVPDRWRSLFHPDDQPAIEADVRDLLANRLERARRQVRFRRADGRGWWWFDGELNAVRDSSQRVVALEGLLTDVTASKSADERIAHLVSHDVLTGLSNRAAFVEQLQHAFAQARRGGNPFAVLYLDIDHFKDINDAYGHENGDLFLLAVAERLRDTIRESDVLGHFTIARFGGDEFAVLQANVGDPSDAAALSQRINKTMAQTFAIGSNAIHATVSIGISLYEASLKDANEMLAQADLALYRAKDAGRNQFHFHSSDLDVVVRERVAVGEELHAALQKRELELYFQPQVEVPSGRIVGLEALIRWNHPSRGLVEPEHFIGTAEKTGIISEMGQWAIENTCQQIRRWRNENCNPPLVAVNVSAVQLRDADRFLHSVQESLRQSGLTGEAIELELTESTLVETTKAHDDVLHRLRAIDVRIAIDDFGTGYSSLQYLQSHPVSRIKIAQQFMTNAASARGDAAIVRATIGLARALDLDVVAEGVETAEQLAFLLSVGCHKVQGFYFSPPVNAQKASEILRRGRFDAPHSEPSDRAMKA